MRLGSWPLLTRRSSGDSTSAYGHKPNVPRYPQFFSGRSSCLIWRTSPMLLRTCSHRQTTELINRMRLATGQYRVLDETRNTMKEITCSKYHHEIEHTRFRTSQSSDYDAVDPPPSLALLRRHQHKPPALGHVKGHSSDLDTAGDQCVRAPVRQPSHRHCHGRGIGVPVADTLSGPIIESAEPIA